MSIRDDLIEIETRLWKGNADDYRDALDEDCLVAFTSMAGVSAREDVARSVAGDEPRWRDLDIDVEGLLRPTDDTALVTYRAGAVHDEGGDRYRALVSSGYVRRDGEWKLMFHQQTPLTG